VDIIISDNRARTFLKSEVNKNLSKSYNNILAINITAVIGNKKHWHQLIAAGFTPDRNCRVGAIIIFEEHIVGEPLRARISFSVIKN
jgi:hypothetical protein